MKLERLFWSKKPPAVGVTIVTGLNPSRLNQLESQCRSFHGPISAAVYVNIHNPDKLPELGPAQRKQLTDAADEIQRFHDRWVVPAAKRLGGVHQNAEHMYMAVQPPIACM
jgi:hypothetical protein